MSLFQLSCSISWEEIHGRQIWQRFLVLLRLGFLKRWCWDNHTGAGTGYLQVHSRWFAAGGRKSIGNGRLQFFEVLRRICGSIWSIGTLRFMHLAPGAKIRLWFSSQELLNLNQKIFHALSLSILLLLRLPRGSHQETKGWSWSRGTFWENQHRHIWIATGSGGRINALEPK